MSTLKPVHLSRDEDEEIHEVFNYFDKGRKGWITLEKAEQIYEQLEAFDTKDELKAAMNDLAFAVVNKGSRVQYEDFTSVLFRTMHNEYTNKEVTRAFQILEHDSSGFIKTKKLIRTLEFYAKKGGITHEEAEKLVKNVGCDTDNYFATYEYIHALVDE